MSRLFKGVMIILSVKCGDCLSFPIDLLNRIVDIQSTKPNVQVRLTRVGVKKSKVKLTYSG